jgi:DNA-binding transcriptional LysR family regulator
LSAFSRELHSFIEIGRERSIRRASEKLNISASALSRQVQILERDLGVSLLVRLPQGIQLTEEGRALLGQAERWIGDEGNLRETLRVRPQGPVRTFRIGLMECLIPVVLPAIDAMQHRRKLALDVTVGNTKTLTELITLNELDAILAFNVPRLAQIRVHDEVECALGLVHVQTMTPGGKPPFRLEECMEWPLCLLDASMSIRPRLDAELHRSRANPKVVLRSNSVALILKYVAAGKGVSFLTWLDVAAGVARGDFLFSPVASRRLAERLHVCIAANAKIDPLLLSVLDHIGRALPKERRG